eukprot:CAMPEP_0114982378 /NCGR_PEP_ID=MMETSP0216-20121206/6077_1 /TAXON_ID=223996 /ORGANISM="Protocruzia adherens, Strain Boccale" /LENGTH=93 /DNA_ID=CAMNT_0002344175 /DNA_START=86 /DNA_END=367 /DNA_ORIENTATION=+
MICTTILWTKFFGTLLTQGFKGFATGNRPPEDTGVGLGNQSYGMTEGTVSDAAKENEIRWKRVVQNDTENIPLGLVVMWGALAFADDYDAHAG